MDFLREVKRFQDKNRVFRPNLLVGYDSAEIAYAESAIGFPLPAAFRDYLAWTGKLANNVISRTGHQWSGDSGFRVSNAEHLKQSRELLAYEGLPAESLLPENSIVFWYYQGYTFRFLRTDEGDNPPMYSYSEGDSAITKTHERFSDYVLDAMKLADRQAARVWLLEMGKLAKLTQPDERVERLSFNGTIKFKAIPDEIFDFVNLRDVEFARKGLEVVDEKIGTLSHLTKLDLRSNRLRSLPDSIQYLENLEHLNLEDNPIDEAEIAKIQRWLPNCEIVR